MSDSDTVAADFISPPLLAFAELAFDLTSLFPGGVVLHAIAAIKRDTSTRSFFMTYSFAEKVLLAHASMPKPDYSQGVFARVKAEAARLCSRSRSYLCRARELWERGRLARIECNARNSFKHRLWR